MPKIVCNDCQKEITAGKYYVLSRNVPCIEGNFEKYCPPCADKEKITFKDLIREGFVTINEAEIGNKIDDDILEFEEQWKNYNLYKIQDAKRSEVDELINVEWLQEARQKLEPYLQKPDIVEKSFGGENSILYFYYWFAQSAHDDNYRQEVVNKTVAEIFGEKPTPEINVNVDEKEGWMGEKIGNLKVKYNWCGGEGNYHLIRFELNDRKLALQSHCRALAIKEKELREETPEPNKPTKIPQPVPDMPSKNESNPTNQTKPTNWTLITILGISGTLVISGLIIYLLKRKKQKK